MDAGLTVSDFLVSRNMRHLVFFSNNLPTLRYSARAVGRRPDTLRGVCYCHYVLDGKREAQASYTPHLRSHSFSTRELRLSPSQRPVLFLPFPQVFISGLSSPQADQQYIKLHGAEPQDLCSLASQGGIVSIYIKPSTCRWGWGESSVSRGLTSQA